MGCGKLRELGIPAWTDASIMGKGVYGWEGFVVVGGQGTMVWWLDDWPEENDMALPN